MTTCEQTTYVLSEEMQSLVYWSSIYSPADADIDSVRAAYDAMCRHYTLPRDGKIEVEDRVVANAEHPVPVRIYSPKLNDLKLVGRVCCICMAAVGWSVDSIHMSLLPVIYVRT